MPYEVIMIRKDSPSFQAPTEITSNAKQPAVQDLQALSSSKVMFLVVRSGRKEVGAPRREFVERSVRPASLLGCSHVGNIQSAVAAALCRRTPYEPRSKRLFKLCFPLFQKRRVRFLEIRCL